MANVATATAMIDISCLLTNRVVSEIRCEAVKRAVVGRLPVVQDGVIHGTAKVSIHRYCDCAATVYRAERPRYLRVARRCDNNPAVLVVPGVYLEVTVGDVVARSLVAISEPAPLSRLRVTIGPPLMGSAPPMSTGYR